MNEASITKALMSLNALPIPERLKTLTIAERRFIHTSMVLQALVEVLVGAEVIQIEDLHLIVEGKLAMVGSSDENINDVLKTAFYMPYESYEEVPPNGGNQEEGSQTGCDGSGDPGDYKEW